MTESQLEKKCRAYAKSKGCWLAKWTSPGTAGVPDDILFLPDGRVMLLEFKARGKKATKLQQHYLDKLADMDFTAVVVDNFEDFKEMI